MHVTRNDFLSEDELFPLQEIIFCHKTLFPKEIFFVTRYYCFLEVFTFFGESCSVNLLHCLNPTSDNNIKHDSYNIRDQDHNDNCDDDGDDDCDDKHDDQDDDVDDDDNDDDVDDD